MLRGLMLGAPVDDVFDSLHPEVVVWSPSLCATNRAELSEVLRQVQVVELRGNTLTEVSLQVTDSDCTSTRVFLEWRLTGRFSHPCFVDDDLLISPSGRLVETAGVLVATVSDGLLTALHCYYDDLAMLEQFVTVT